MSKAGTNELKFKTFVNSKYGKNTLKGKIKYGKTKEVNISVDNHIEINDKKILIEIDSGNMAKLLVGQYTLLNLLCDERDDKDILFIVIHYYKKYNADRTIKNLKKVNEDLFNSEGIKFRAFNISKFKEICNENKNIKDLIKELYIL